MIVIERSGTVHFARCEVADCNVEWRCEVGARAAYMRFIRQVEHHVAATGHPVMSKAIRSTHYSRGAAR